MAEMSQGIKIEIWESQTGSRHISPVSPEKERFDFDFIINYEGRDYLLLREGRVIACLPGEDSEEIDEILRSGIADEWVRGVLWSGGYFSLAPRKEEEQEVDLRR